MHEHVQDALKILECLGMPKAQRNERSALCLLALLHLTPDKNWNQVDSPLIGITPIMEFCRNYYAKEYAPNTRETVRRQTIHQFVEAGVALYNPDDPKRPVNSPKAVYQIEIETFNLLKTYKTEAWDAKLATYLSKHKTLQEKYAKARDHHLISLQIPGGTELQISPGEHSGLIKLIIEQFGPRFVPGGEVLYVGDTGEKWSFFDQPRLKELGVEVNSKGKMPDVILFYPEKKWLILIESVTSHGPVDGKRHNELATLFKASSVGIVYVTAFPSRSIMSRYIAEIAWETEVWIADAPSHLIHFNGIRFLGPYPST